MFIANELSLSSPRNMCTKYCMMAGVMEIFYPRIGRELSQAVARRSREFYFVS